jgi:F-type H+-transporting ATPase subunit b
MLDISLLWLSVQMASFLALLFVLNIILFKPVLNQLKERDDRINGYLDKAKVMDKDKDNLLKELDAKLAQTRDQAKMVYEELRSKGLEAQRNDLDSAGKETEKMSQEALEKLKAAADRARESLRGNVEAFSKKIVEKMVGV